MATSAIDQLTSSGAATPVDSANVETWLTEDGGLSALIFTGRSKRRAEGHDVAVALRELARQYQGQLQLGVVQDADEDAVMRRIGVVVLPSVVLFVGGEPIEKMPRLRDWGEYADAARRYLGSPPSRDAA